MQAHGTGQNCILVIEKGEELVTTVAHYAEKNSLASAIFHGIGGANRVKLGVYNETLGNYAYSQYTMHLEISSLTGNVFLHQGRPMVHVHGVFSGSGGISFGGHVAECEISPLCEVHLTRLAELKLSRKGPLPLPGITGD